jgi:4-hydroxy-tetrahydrodipicolinate synthase
MSYPSFRGVATELLTPFNEDGSIAFDLLAGEVERQISAGVVGLFTNGLASEQLSLTREERAAVTSCVVECVNHRVPVMANIPDNTALEAEKALHAYEVMGVDAVCLQAPYGYAVPQANLLAHFDHLARATSLPVGFYNAPQTGNTADPQTVGKLFEANPNMHYYKESTINFQHVQATLRLIGHDGVDFLNGTDSTTASLMKLGGNGVVSLISAVFPQPVIDLVAAAQAGDWAKADQAQDFVLRIRSALKTGPMNAGYKYVSGLLGAPLGHMRAPMAELSDSEAATIRKSLTDLGLLD